VSHEKLSRRLTMRAADKWESARFTGSWLASSFFCSRTLSTLRPLAANAGRSAAQSHRENTFAEGGLTCQRFCLFYLEASLEGS